MSSAFVSFSLPYQGDTVVVVMLGGGGGFTVILQTRATLHEKIPDVLQPAGCLQWRFCCHRSVSLRTVSLLLFLLPPLILFHPLESCPHMHALRELTPTCTHTYVRSVYFLTVELVITTIVSGTISSVCPFMSNVSVPAILVFLFFFFFLSL